MEMSCMILFWSWPRCARGERPHSLSLRRWKNYLTAISSVEMTTLQRNPAQCDSLCWSLSVIKVWNANTHDGCLEQTRSCAWFTLAAFEVHEPKMTVGCYFFCQLWKRCKLSRRHSMHMYKKRTLWWIICHTSCCVGLYSTYKSRTKSEFAPWRWREDKGPVVQKNNQFFVVWAVSVPLMLPPRITKCHNIHIYIPPPSFLQRFIIEVKEETSFSL